MGGGRDPHRRDQDLARPAHRAALYVPFTSCTKPLTHRIHLITADYEKIAAGYSRFFLWTSFRFYAPLRFIRAVVNRENLESVAGPFDKLKISSTQVALAYMMAWWLGVKL